MDDRHAAPDAAAPDGSANLGALYERFAPMLAALAARALPPALSARLDAADVVRESCRLTSPRPFPA